MLTLEKKLVYLDEMPDLENLGWNVFCAARGEIRAIRKGPLVIWWRRDVTGLWDLLDLRDLPDFRCFEEPADDDEEADLYEVALDARGAGWEPLLAGKDYRLLVKVVEDDPELFA